MKQFRYGPVLPEGRVFTVGDGVILLVIAALLYAGVRLAFAAPAAIAGPAISLSPLAFPGTRRSR